MGWFDREMRRWLNSDMRGWFGDWMVRWFGDGLVRWFGDWLVRWFGDWFVRWFGSWMVRWFGGRMLRWFGYGVVRRFCGYIDGWRLVWWGPSTEGDLQVAGHTILGLQGGGNAVVHHFLHLGDPKCLSGDVCLRRQVQQTCIGVCRAGGGDYRCVSAELQVPALA